MFYEMPPFLPDRLPRGDVLTRCENVYPAVKGYRAAAGFQSVSDALPAEFRGAASFISTDGVAYLLAGTANGLVRLQAGGWNVLLTALSVPQRWRFVQFGDYVICANLLQTQEVDLNAASASAISGAPAFSDLFVVGNHVVGTQPDGNILKVRWSAFGDHTAWQLGTDQAGDFTLLTGGEVMGGAGGENNGVILQRQRITRMDITGDPDAPFQFSGISDNWGCASKASIAQAGRSVFCLSDRGFIAIEDGQTIRPIGNEKFDRSFRDEIGIEDYERIWSAVDPTQTIVMWGVPGLTGTVWVYNWALDKASTLKMPFEGLFAGFENSVTLEELDAIYPDSDAMPYSLDDPRFSGGAPRMYFVRDGEIGTLTGPNLKAFMETGEFAPGGVKTTRLRAIWPETDAIDGLTIVARQSQRKGDNPENRKTTQLRSSGRMPIKTNGKYYSFCVEIDSPNWTYFDALTLEASTGGVR